MSDLVVVDKCFGELEPLDKDGVRNFIAETEKRMLELGTPVEIPLKHHFSKDVYAREIVIPKGALIVGKIHKHTNLNILSKGKITLLSIDGCKTVEAPYTVVSSPGVKRLAYAHEECVWTTIHGTNETDVDKIEELFIAKDYNDETLKELELKEAVCLGS